MNRIKQNNMSNTNKKYLMTIVILFVLGLFNSSCSKDKHDDSPRPFKLFLKAVDADQNDITQSGEVQQVMLFVFNEKQEAVNVVNLDANQIKNREPIQITPELPNLKSLSFVAWGNVDEKVEIPSAASVKNLTDLYIKLKAGVDGNNHLNNGGESLGKTARSPGDLFYGKLDAPVEYGSLEPTGDQTVIISRKTSQIHIVANNLKAWNNHKDGTYTFELRESHEIYNPDCKLTGEMVGYLPVATLNEKGNLATPIFNTFPTTEGKSYTLFIRYNGDVIYTTDSSSDGSKFIPEPGRLLNIIIDFSASIDVKVVVTPWDQVFQSVEI